MQRDYDGLAEAMVSGAKRYVDAQLGPLLRRIEEQDRQIKALSDRPMPAGIAGSVKDADGVLILTLTDGRTIKTDIRDGKPGQEPAVLPDIPALVDAAVKALPATPGKDADMAAVAALVADHVATAVSALPKAKDGVGLAGAVITREGTLMLTLTDGTTRDLGRVVGADADMAALQRQLKAMVEAIPRAKDGVDGLGFDDMEFTSGEDGAFLTFTRGEQRKTFRIPIPIDRGVFRDGSEYRAGDGVTWGGSFWIAQRDTRAKPDAGNGDWRLAVKKGRDGKDAKGDK